MEINGTAGRIGLEGDVDLQFLFKGGDLLKVKSSSWKKTRFYQLMEDCKTVMHQSRKTFKRNPTFNLEDIESVRYGRQSEGFQKYTDSSVEDRCFTIIFKNRRKNLDLIASSKEEAKQWVKSLEKVMNRMSNLTRQENSEHWFYSCMRKADKNSDNKMSLKELKQFLGNINIEVDDRYAENLFKKCDTSNSGTLEGAEIKQFYDLLTYREEIDIIYGKYNHTNGQMSSADLLSFLQNEQKEPVSLDYALNLINKYEVDETAKQRKHMTKDGFLIFLNQEEGGIFNPAHKDLFQDMRQPLNHYFISSSHNTYLMADQLKGPSSTEAYVKALMKGCRCVELDCWDGANGEPVIYHGHTLTSKVLFSDVIRAIQKYAFKTSQYPVILSIENHCTLEQQKVMAYHLTSILGNALLTLPLGNHMPSTFPGPEELKGRFLIKGKCLKKLDAAFNNNTTEDVDSVSEEDEAAELKENEQKVMGKSKKIKLAKELSDLVIYCKSVHFSGFEHSRDNQAFYEMASFKESKAMNLAENSGMAYIHHNMDKLSRIYPAGSRTDSSNYNPVPLWNAGCQIVALNFQTHCKEMDLNQGRFLPNARCGYVLKPKFQRDPASQFDPKNLSVGPWLQRKTVHIMIISAQQLPKLNKDKPKSIVDPQVRVEICGVPADNDTKQTHHIDNNGFNPKWNTNFKFIVHVPELALVRFLVEDFDAASFNDFIGQYTVPLTSMQNGYRHVPLLTKSGDAIPSAGLFVHIMVLDA
ncbi:1-phosphatidylinositol 4,5-bisphosphate phosphodiesterase delta-1-like isoform X2 [Xyrauchen texanus]|uniref:1-phosphatidylinositol 4,5-bisphosphate phosphodiesterase delta-1-like isoform X2 n=1 Tax=Xyrauchen texanus TaxID=154827 RepID=UPI002242692B|nr:1-phosphatidylinositol 4,5-bisphosphate phosphodiesterase delta-1-like isoform X2 [Xyrauchen texanus]